jgi:uncharacterized protein (TIGR02246 family)
MKRISITNLSLLTGLALWCSLVALPLFAQDDKVTAEIRGSAEKFVQAFNAGEAANVAKQFLKEGELIDEEGTTYQGRAAIEEVFQRYFDRFAGAKLALDVESVRVTGPQLAIEEGTRVVVREKDGGRAQLRYIAVRAKVDGEWGIASLREFSADPPATPRDFLAPLAWLEGDWINEGGDAVVRISYRWSADGNYLLGEYSVSRDGKALRVSSQRVGWDAQAATVRSWLFEGDGAFSEARWTATGGGETGKPESWVLKSTGVTADGQSGSATLQITQEGKDRFKLSGRDRVVAGVAADDFEILIVRRPPSASK